MLLEILNHSVYVRRTNAISLFEILEIRHWQNNHEGNTGGSRRRRLSDGSCPLAVLALETEELRRSLRTTLLEHFGYRSEVAEERGDREVVSCRDVI